MLPPPVSLCVPRVGKGQVLLQAISSAPSSYKPCTVWCVNCTDAQLPTVFTRRHCCSTAFKASLPMAFSMRALHCSSAEQLSRGSREQIYAREGFGSGAASPGLGSHTGSFAPATKPIRITMASLCALLHFIGQEHIHIILLDCVATHMYFNCCHTILQEKFQALPARSSTMVHSTFATTQV